MVDARGVKVEACGLKCTCVRARRVEVALRQAAVALALGLSLRGSRGPCVCPLALQVLLWAQCWVAWAVVVKMHSWG